MLRPDKQTYDDQVLIDYLLGSLPEAVGERLDELSVADDEFAWRLSAVENDLVDAYVRGELSGEILGRFETFYLSSPKRREKVTFAEAMRIRAGRITASPAQATPAISISGSRPKKELPRGVSPWRLFTVPRLALQWGFAGGALAMLFMASYLLLENAGLRRQTTEALGSHAALDQREQELQRQLSDQRAANLEMAKDLQRLRESQPNLDQLKTLSALLLPPTRGARRIPTVSVPPGTSLVVLLLALESDDFPAYRVELKDPATNQTVWHSASMEAATSGGNKIVSISFPASLLKQQHYILELSGVPSSGRAKLISGYPIRVVIR